MVCVFYREDRFIVFYSVSNDGLKIMLVKLKKK